MPDKCEFCGDKVKNGVCTGCGMDYNRASTASAENAQENTYNAYGQPKDDSAAQENNNEDDMFKKALEDGLKNSKAMEKKGIIIGVVLCVVLSAAVIIYGICTGAFFEASADAQRAADRKAEQALTERPRISIPKVSIPKVNIPKITVPDADLGEDFQKALDHDIQALIELNGLE